MNAKRRTLFLPPLVVFVAVMIIVISSFFVSLDSLEQERRDIALEFMQETELRLQSRIQNVEEVLRSGTGVLADEITLETKNWEQFVQATQVLDRYPGTQGVGYITVFPSSERGRIQQQIATQQNRDFQVHPTDSNQSFIAPVLHLEPRDERNQQMIGYDMFSESVRRQAMHEARDSGEVTISNAVLVHEGAQGNQDSYGFLMFAPQYQANASIESTADRQQSIQGFVYAVFDGQDFLSSVLGNNRQEQFAYQISKPSRDGLVKLYETEQFTTIHEATQINVQRNVNIKGSTWEFTYTYQPDAILTETITTRPMTILLFGLFSALLIAGFTYLLLRGKTHELALAQERETNEAKDSLLSIASHQLRTPATGVKQYIGMVLQGFAGEISQQQRHLLEKAYDSNERQLKTINDVLYLARLDAGRIVLTKSRVELKELIKSSIEEQQNRIDENQHKVKLDLPKQNVYVYADEHMLRMAVENLLSNAVKYTRRKGTIAVTLQRSQQEVRIAVKDNGVGISDEDLDTLFTQFSRIPNELSKSVSGTGIGLYLARHLLLLHGGDITVTSEKGVGSTFTIRLPKNK